ncbi:iduronate 2-sulfatase [Fopius arisanus]|uniref:Iduronate 2-sulfatase n=1 Tax=Fopius arisanus TaxID=64838 RepID=A0A9R1SVR3_9HYME|nr:PREDICTED: iduronate 2-sulfatase [Fopius arisanus]
MREVLKYFTLLLLFNFSLGKTNFLFIIVDDLRPVLGCYSDGKSVTPNIDRLAKNGITFNKAYAQQALCAPSRNSFLTSRRPDTLRLYDFYSYWRQTAGNFTTLPQYLKNHGYMTVSIGKVFHPGISSNNSDDSPYSWSREAFHPATNRYKDSPLCTSDSNKLPARNLVCPVDIPSMPLGTLPDIENSEAAKKFLNDYKINLKKNNGDKPFFLAVGFEKPHIPLKHPREYLRLHPLEKFKLTDYYWPDNVSSVAYNPWTDLREREDVRKLNLTFPWEKIPEDFGKTILQSYYSSVSYIDQLIGEIIAELTTSGLYNNTIVILTSDHGWSLGEHSQWGKYSNFDVAVRVPLIVSLPGHYSNNFSSAKKIKTNAIIELVDLFPTIAELSGNPIDVCPENKSEITCSEGISFVPVINAILHNKTVKWKRAAFSQYPRPGAIPTWSPNSDKPRLHQITIMGYTLRTKSHRYTAWIKFDNVTLTSDWNTLIADELYDHTLDPHEMMNQVNNTDYLTIKNKLKKLLKNGWRQSFPRHM